MIESLGLTDLLPFQIKELIDELYKLLNIENNSKDTICKIIKNENSSICCPHCHSENIVKNGHTKKKLQTYKCKNCNKRFNDLTGTVFHHTHLSYEQITNFFKCMRDKFSIRKTAKIVGISKTAAFAIRHKILSGLKEIREKIKLQGELQVDEYYLSINLKGTKRDNMPRTSKPRKTSGNCMRGINKHKVCVETGIDGDDHTFLEIVGTGPITSEMIKKSLVPKTEKVSKIITDCKSSYERVAKENKWNLVQIKSGTYTNETGDNLACINALHSGLENFLSLFHGVSTNHLQGYLDWYMFDKYINYTAEILEQVHNFEINIITKNTLMTYSNIYNNYSGLNYSEIYKDYNYHANSST